ncbi:sensor histidine kinase [Actinocorallia populi]|uniref:sensor histidine kinase n=1 Tax=Actinocorallia populi TaxID=2079200 RepID=UPI000D0965D1|nr:sensor histidine kinase [Actinocorallia populi]
MTGGKAKKHPIWDMALFAVLAAPIVATLPDRPAELWTQGAGLAGLALAVGISRRLPAAALAIGLSLTALHGNFVFGAPVFACLAGLRMERTRPVARALAAVFAGGALLNVVRGVEVTTWFPLTVWLVLLGVLPWLAGRCWRQYTELVAAGWQRAEQLEREQRIIGERERLRERSRIAEDMHDALGHELSLLALRAAALEVAPELPERYQNSARELREGTASATERLQQIIGVLREEPEAARTRPAGETVADLVERARSSGMAVDLAETGGPAPLLADLAAHRLVQEALTNATKHAPGAPVRVRLSRESGETRVEVVNGPPPAGPLPGAPGGRLGLMRLRERVQLTGGTFEAGPTGEGGFAVRAWVPHAAAPVAGRPDSESAAHLASGRRRVRRGLAAAVAVPAVLLALLGAIMAAYHLYVTYASVLSPADYRRVELGRTPGELDPLLPSRQAPLPEGERRPGCRYYHVRAEPLGGGDVHRLCFTGGRLTSKQTLREGER